jgi:hypothetical protein
MREPRDSAGEHSSAHLPASAVWWKHYSLALAMGMEKGPQLIKLPSMLGGVSKDSLSRFSSFPMKQAHPYSRLPLRNLQYP